MIQSYILCDENMSFKLSNSHSYLKWICIGRTAELHVFQSVSPQVKEVFHIFQLPTMEEGKAFLPKVEERSDLKDGQIHGAQISSRKFSASSTLTRRQET